MTEGTGQSTGVLFLPLFAAVSFSSFQQDKEDPSQGGSVIQMTVYEYVTD